MLKPKFKCPMADCKKEFIQDRHIRSDLIYHLWGHHKLDAPNAHRIANETNLPPLHKMGVRSSRNV